MQNANVYDVLFCNKTMVRNPFHNLSNSDFGENNVRVSQWSAQSLDLNPIETLCEEVEGSIQTQMLPNKQG